MFVFILVLAAFLLLWLKTSIHIVPGKTALIVETFGRPAEAALTPGLNFTMPWPIQAIAGRVNLQLREIKTNVAVKTADNVFLSLPVAVQYRADSEPYGTVKAFYELAEPQEQISSFILNNVRQSAAKMTLEELFLNRSHLQDVVLAELASRFSTYGYVIEAVLVDQPQPSDEVQASFNRVIASQRLMEAARNEAEATRIKLVKTAEAEAESKKLQGQGIANMRIAIAEGIQDSLAQIKKAAPSLNDRDIMDFLTATNRLDTIATAASNGNMIVVDMATGKLTDNTLVQTLVGQEAIAKKKS
jgi:regulator of protease activity HflC (stomatin/prohibitin superfamily)